MKHQHGITIWFTGLSGSGKTTLLNIIGGLDQASSGEITINGNDITSMKTGALTNFRLNHIGFVFQFHYLLADFTVLDNVMLPALKLKQKRKEEIEHKAMELLTLLDIKGHEHKKASKISGGQQQRVAIARALINSPAIIMGDEPKGNLDTKNTQIVFASFQQLAREQGQTIISVTHDEEFAQKCDRIIELSDGEVV